MHTFWDALSFCPDHRQCPNNMYFLFLIIKPTRCTSFSHLFLELNFTCFGQLLCPSSGVFYCTHTAMVCIIQVCRQLASRIRMEHPKPARKLPLFTPGKNPVPILQEAALAPRPVWTGAENLTSTVIWSPDRSQLYTDYATQPTDKHTCKKPEFRNLPLIPEYARGWREIPWLF